MTSITGNPFNNCNSILYGFKDAYSEIYARNSNISYDYINLELINVKKEPDKKTYSAGESFDKTGMEVMATYQYGFYFEVEDYTITPEILSKTDTKVTISYTENNITKTTDVEGIVVKEADTTPPIINSVTGNPASWTNQDVTLTVDATDSESGIATTNGYSFDNGVTWQTANTKKYTQNTSGIKIKVKDNVGNISTYTQTVNIDKIEKEVPTITISPNGASASTPSKNVTITVEDTGGSGLNNSNVYQYQLGTSSTAVPTGDWSDYTSGTAIIIGTELTGDYYLWVKSISDNAGNKSAETITGYTISNKFTFDSTLPSDTTPPIIDSVTGNPASWTNQDVTLTVDATDSESGIATTNGYSFDDGATWQTANTKKYTQNTSGIKIKVKDDEGNIGTYGQAINIDKIDKTKPTISISPNGAVTSQNKSITITVEDIGGSGLNNSNVYQYQLGTSSTAVPTGDWSDYTSGTAITIGTGLTGDYYLWVKSISDNAGNKSAETIAGYTISNKFVFDNIPEELEIESTVYTIESTGYIINISENTTVQSILQNVHSNYEIKVYDKNNQEITGNTKITTGSKIITNETTYILVIKGDTNKDGQISFFDITKLISVVYDAPAGIEECVKKAGICSKTNTSGKPGFFDITALITYVYDSHSW